MTRDGATGQYIVARWSEDEPGARDRWETRRWLVAFGHVTRYPNPCNQLLERTTAKQDKASKIERHVTPAAQPLPMPSTPSPTLHIDSRSEQRYNSQVSHPLKQERHDGIEVL
jgi:hypothetical protein